MTTTGQSTGTPKPADLTWLSEVRDSVQPLSEQFPIWVRHGIVASCPTIPHPERLVPSRGVFERCV